MWRGFGAVAAISRRAEVEARSANEITTGGPMSMDEREHAEMENALRDVFEAYGKAFVVNPALAATFYSEPCITARSGQVCAHSSRVALAALFEEADKQYRARGYTQITAASFDWQRLGVTGALATIRWAYKDKQERTLWQTTFSYNLYKRGGGWTIMLQTMHD